MRWPKVSRGAVASPSLSMPRAVTVARHKVHDQAVRDYAGRRAWSIAEVRTMRLSLPIYGLGCAGLTAERALARVPGVKQVYVNPATQKAYIECDPALTDQRLLIAAVKSAG